MRGATNIPALALWACDLSYGWMEAWRVAAATRFGRPEQGSAAWLQE
jgi:hypothetical protein